MDWVSSKASPIKPLPLLQRAAYFSSPFINKRPLQVQGTLVHCWSCISPQPLHHELLFNFDQPAGRNYLYRPMVVISLLQPPYLGVEG